MSLQNQIKARGALENACRAWNYVNNFSKINQSLELSEVWHIRNSTCNLVCIETFIFYVHFGFICIIYYHCWNHGIREFKIVWWHLLVVFYNFFISSANQMNSMWGWVMGHALPQPWICGVGGLLCTKLIMPEVKSITPWATMRQGPGF